MPEKLKGLATINCAGMRFSLTRSRYCPVCPLPGPSWHLGFSPCLHSLMSCPSFLRWRLPPAWFPHFHAFAQSSSLFLPINLSPIIPSRLIKVPGLPQTFSEHPSSQLSLLLFYVRTTRTSQAVSLQLAVSAGGSHLCRKTGIYIYRERAEAGEYGIPEMGKDK